MRTPLLFLFFALTVLARPSFAWTNGELLVWMDADRAQAMHPLTEKFERDLGIKVKIESPGKLTDNYPIAAQSGKGPDIVIWAHDKVGEWADGGLIAPVEISPDFKEKFLPKAWEAVTHQKQCWGYPISFEVVGLIYNKKLIDGAPPGQVSDLLTFNEAFKRRYPDKMSILWEYSSPFFSWGILASAGAYIYAKNEEGYDLRNVGVDKPGAVEALGDIIKLVQAGVLPKSMPDNAMPKELMAQGRLAMMISGPWDWPDLIKKGVDFGVVPIPGVGGKPGHAFIGVSVAYVNSTSPNKDLANEFIQDYLITDDGLALANGAKPLGLPALASYYEKLAKDDVLIRSMKACADQGEIMPNIPQMGRFWTAMKAAMQIAANGQASAQAALHQAADNMQH